MNLNLQTRHVWYPAVHTTTLIVRKQRRDSTRVIYEMLSVVSDGATKTQLIFKVNLSHQLAERYIQFLLNKGHIAKNQSPSGQIDYSITEKGYRLLRLLRDVERELDVPSIMIPA